VHSGALGWNGMITFGALYYLVPEAVEPRAALQPQGRLLALLARHHRHRALRRSMWVTGIMEGLMWREVNAQGFLVNSFADTVAAKFPMYVVRGLGGVMYLTGALIMVWNLWMTVTRGVRPARTQPVRHPAE
jgi:cytochrome c oxidase cbb3-type subunit 1